MTFHRIALQLLLEYGSAPVTDHRGSCASNCVEGLDASSEQNCLLLCINFFLFTVLVSDPTTLSSKLAFVLDHTYALTKQ